ncbi:unnamed protein product [Closterium sp. NIES-65]|nr:unnamed protein product [Closterium sp. NIES-65]CAI5979192.1 unnamed protein product [Closterium sp. NIES-65]
MFHLFTLHQARSSGLCPIGVTFENSQKILQPLPFPLLWRFFSCTAPHLTLTLLALSFPLPLPLPRCASSGVPHPLPQPAFLCSLPSSHPRWRFFPCASPVPPPSQWVEALAARGIREISFVGDSHQRFLMLFLNYLVMHDVDDALWKFHGDIVINIPPPKGRADLKPLKLNFYWVDGMYHNDEYGCT